MNEGLKGVLQLKFVMVFLVIFIVIIGAGLKFLTAFRVKNEMIDYIEMYQGYCMDDTYDVTSLEECPSNVKIKDYAMRHGFFKSSSETSLYSIERVDITDEESYYVVTTYIKFGFAFVNVKFTLPVKGQTGGVIVKTGR